MEFFEQRSTGAGAVAAAAVAAYVAANCPAVSSALLRGTARDVRVPFAGGEAVVTLVAVGVKNGGGGPDDKVYLAHPELQTAVPRGLVVLGTALRVAANAEGADPHVLPVGTPVLTGLPKMFGYTADDDDDAAADDGAGCGGVAADGPGGLDAAGTAIVMAEKANGHFVQWSAVYAVGPGGDVVPYVFAGTKSVGCGVALADLVLMEGGADNAAPLAAKLHTTTHIADLLLLLGRFLRQVTSRGGPEVVAEVMQVLVTRTVVGECVNAQHMVFPVDAEDRALAPSVVFFSTLPPVFPTVRKTELTDDDERAQRLHCFRSGYNHEGYVLERVARDGAVVRRWKYKTWWYVLCRCLRELYRDDDTVEVTLAKLHHRAAVLNQRTLHVGLDTLHRWLAEYFAPLVRYMKGARVSKRRIAFDGEGFAPVLREFQVSAGFTTAALEAMFQYDGGKPPEAVLEYAVKLAKQQLGVAVVAGAPSAAAALTVVLLTGPPGMGKTALADAMEEAVQRRCLGGGPGAAAAVVSLSQDQFSRGGLDRGASTKFFDALAAAVANPVVQYIIVHRCNVMAREVDQVFTAVKSERSGRGLGARLVVVKPAETGTVELLTACLAGVVQADRATHRTMGTLAAAEAMQVAFMFWEASKDSFKPRVEHSVVELQWLRTPSEFAPADSGPWSTMVAGVEHAVAVLGSPFPGQMAFRRPKGAFVLSPGLVKTLQQCTVQPRLSVSELCDQLCSKLLVGGAGGGGGASAAGAGAGAGAVLDSGVQYVCIKFGAKLPLPKGGTGVVRMSGGPGVKTTADHVTLKYAPTTDDMAAWLPWVGTTVLVTARGLYLRAPANDLSATRVCAVRRADGGGGGGAEFPAELLPANPHVTLQFAPKTAAPAEAGALVSVDAALVDPDFGFADVPGVIDLVWSK
jgi:hypothetical protein